MLFSPRKLVCTMKFEVDGGPADSPTRKHIESTKIFPLISYSHKLPYLKDRTFFFFFLFFSFLFSRI